MNEEHFSAIAREVGGGYETAESLVLNGEAECP